VMAGGFNLNAFSADRRIRARSTSATRAEMFV